MIDDHIGVKINGILYVKLDDVIPMRARIEKLEAQLAQSQLKRWAAIWEEQSDRIEKLELALVDMSQHVSMANWHHLKPETLATLEGTDA